MSSTGSSVPKFGEWDVNNPASADGFSVIFKKASEEKRAGTSAGHNHNLPSPRKYYKDNYYKDKSKPPAIKKWFCCAHLP
ncbi:hypothetical protein Pint_28631 [Pistacia integerrima]|uniref:Uncharacterized protein n=1 Tax=Pistacia integerrima TaxID=434235 RepID=A0ACC0YQV0_9ROSI|nr:hypothetical protein Pint_28631 [Pistacia integerrima]